MAERHPQEQEPAIGPYPLHRPAMLRHERRGLPRRGAILAGRAVRPEAHPAGRVQHPHRREPVRRADAVGRNADERIEELGERLGAEAQLASHPQGGVLRVELRELALRRLERAIGGDEAREQRQAHHAEQQREEAHAHRRAGKRHARVAAGVRCARVG
jgi:hypothetical protein